MWCEVSAIAEGAEPHYGSSLSAGDRYSHALFLNIGTGNVWGSPEFICCRFRIPISPNWQGLCNGLPTAYQGGSPFFTLYSGRPLSAPARRNALMGARMSYLIGGN